MHAILNSVSLSDIFHIRIQLKTIIEMDEDTLISDLRLLGNALRMLDEHIHVVSSDRSPQFRDLEILYETLFQKTSHLSDVLHSCNGELLLSNFWSNSCIRNTLRTEITETDEEDRQSQNFSQECVPCILIQFFYIKARKYRFLFCREPRKYWKLVIISHFSSEPTLGISVRDRSLPFHIHNCTVLRRI